MSFKSSVRRKVSKMNGGLGVDWGGKCSFALGALWMPLGARHFILGAAKTRVRKGAQRGIR
jgi:hypothetical protein